MSSSEYEEVEYLSDVSDRDLNHCETLKENTDTKPRNKRYIPCPKEAEDFVQRHKVSINEDNNHSIHVDSKRHGLKESIKEVIKQLFDDGIKKPEAILGALKDRNLEKPTKIQLKSFLSSLQTEKCSYPVISEYYEIEYLSDYSDNDGHYEPVSESDSDIDHTQTRKSTRNKTRQKKNWQKKKQFSCSEDAENFIKSLSQWKKCAAYSGSAGVKVKYRCTLGIYRKKECTAGLYLLYHSDSKKVTLYEANNHSNHDNEKRGIKPSTKEIIRQLFDDGIKKPNIILGTLRDRNLEEPNKQQLTNFLSTLRTNKRTRRTTTVKYKEIESSSDESDSVDNRWLHVPMSDIDEISDCDQRFDINSDNDGTFYSDVNSDSDIGLDSDFDIHVKYDSNAKCDTGANHCQTELEGNTNEKTRKSRHEKNWLKKREFSCPTDAETYVKSLSQWKKCTTYKGLAGVRVCYRCTLGAYRKQECTAGLYLFYHLGSQKVSLYEADNHSNHVHSIQKKVKGGINPKIRKIIRELYHDGDRKPNAIIRALQAKNIKEPNKRQLITFLSSLRKSYRPAKSECEEEYLSVDSECDVKSDNDENHSQEQQNSIKHKKKSRNSKNWLRTCKFAGRKEAEAYVQSLYHWKKTSSYESVDGIKIFYRCTRAAYRKQECSAGLYLFYSKNSPEVCLYQADNHSNHVENVKRGLHPSTKDIIRQLFKEGVRKPNNIIGAFQDRNLEEPDKGKLKHFISTLRTKRARRTAKYCDVEYLTDVSESDVNKIEYNVPSSDVSVDNHCQVLAQSDSDIHCQILTQSDSDIHCQIETQSPDNTVKPKKTRNTKIWRKRREFSCAKEAEDFVKSLSQWRKRSADKGLDGVKIRYRCTLGLYRKQECDAGLCLLYHADSEKVTLYDANSHTNHLDYVKRGLNPTTKQIIKQLYDDGVMKPSAIMDALRGRNLAEPNKFQLNAYLYTLRNKKFG